MLGGGGGRPGGGGDSSRAARRCRSSSARSISAACSSACGRRTSRCSRGSWRRCSRRASRWPRRWPRWASRPTTRSWRWCWSRSGRRSTRGRRWPTRCAAHPTIFPDLYVNMVRSGEAAGNLDAVLLRLADFMDAQNALRAKVVGRADLSDHHDGPGRDRHGHPDGRRRPEDHRGLRGPGQGAALEHRAADLRVRRGRQLLVAADHRCGVVGYIGYQALGAQAAGGARSSIG